MPVTIQFGRLTQTHTAFRVHPKPDEVFAPDEIDRCKDLFRPALTVDLSCVRPSWSGLAHFVYHEPREGHPSRFLLDGDRYTYLGDFSECDPEAEIEHDAPTRAPYVELVPTEVPLFDEPWTATPRAVDACRLVYERSRRLCQYWNTLAERHAPAPAEIEQKILGWDPSVFFFGHMPNWTQHDETPLDPDGRPMAFVGQLRADFLTEHAADFDLYLFYSPRHRLVSQVLQMT